MRATSCKLAAISAFSLIANDGQNYITCLLKHEELRMKILLTLFCKRLYDEKKQPHHQGKKAWME